MADKGPRLPANRWQSWLWWRILGVPRLSLGAHCLIVGERHLSLGAGFRAGRGLWLEAVTRYEDQALTPRLRVGARFSGSDWVHVACAFEVTIGDDVLVGSKVHITDHNHGCYNGTAADSSPARAPAQRALAGAPVRIGDKVFLADGVVVLPGADIGPGVIVGANSVVRGHLPADTLCVGTPATPIKRYNPISGTWQPLN